MRVLIADDDPVTRLYLQDALEEWGYEVVSANDGKSACELLLQPDAPQLAIIDWMMPEMDGIDVCRAIRLAALERYIYLIMLTSRAETEFIVQAMTAGADDFVGKPFNAEELRVRVRAGGRICELEEELRLKATHDALTGIYNRGVILEILRKEVGRSARVPAPLSIVFADLDHFKQINDKHGHLAGDEVLREVARRTGSALRPYDSLGRFGGEELLIVLPGCPAEGARVVAERVRAALADRQVATDFGAIAATLSIGVATMDGVPGWSPDELIHRADMALYLAKSKGRNRVEQSEDHPPQ